MLLVNGPLIRISKIMCPKENFNERCEISLAIQGSQRNGYHLIMSPSGFFTADSWYNTKEEALKNAEELFGILTD